MKIESSFPNEKLSDFVKEFFYLQIDSDNQQTMVAIDDGCYDLMFYKEKVATLEFEQNNSIKIDSKAFTVHQLNPPLKYTFEKGVSYFSIKIQPWFNTFFFPIHYEKGILNLETVYGNQITRIQSAISESSSFQEKVRISEEFLMKIKPELNDDLNLVKEVCLEIYKKDGIITVNELSDRFELDRQLLNKVFKMRVNYTLKRFIIIVRIINLAKFKINNPDSTLTEVALEYGYFDQAHFNYDFKRISGVTPTKFFKNLPPFFQRHKK
jgi:AraC-like DNA-binding protein